MLDMANKFLLEKVVRIKKPAAKIVGVAIEDVSSDGVTLNTKISVDNPYAKSLPVSEISYAVQSADRFVVRLLFSFSCHCFLFSLFIPFNGTCDFPCKLNNPNKQSFIGPSKSIHDVV